MRKNIFGLLVLLFIVLLSSCTMVAEHEWSPWTITKEPTCMEEGERVSTCVLCDETKTEKVAKISHKLDANNKCSMCGSYYVLSSAGNGETLVDKLKNALDGINSSSAESKVLYLEGGEYDLSQIEDLSISVSGLTIHGASSSTDGTKTTFLVSSSNGLKVKGDFFALDNVAFTLTGDTTSSTEPVLSLTGDKATVKNTSFEMGSYTNPAIGVIEEGQTLTLDSVTISGGGTLNTEGTLVITGSNIKTTVSPAINGDKGDITIKSSTIEGSLTTSENLNSLTIEGSTLTGGKGEIKGTNVTIKDSTLDNWNLSVNAKTTTVANSTINSDSIKITGATDSSATVESSNLSAKDIVISSNNNTITGSNLNKGKKENSLTIGGKTAEIASSTLDGKVTVSTTEKTDIKENSSINASDTKSSGSFVVTDGEVTISGSVLSGDITFETGTDKATITNSTVDTSTGNNAITTGTDLKMKDSTVTKGSGLYVTKDAKNIDIEITNSLVSDGSNVVDITSDNVTAVVFSKSIPEDKESSAIGLSDSQSSASLKVGTDYTSVPFTFKDSNENEIRVNIGKKGSTVNLSEFFEKNVKDYVNPKFYTDSTCSYEISDSKITVVDANKYKVGDTVYNSIYVKWEYRVTYTGGDGKEITTNTENGKFTISTPTKDGYVFDGWRDRDGNTLEPTETDEKVTVTLTSPSTLEPIWVKTYVVTFDVNGGNKLTSSTVIVRTGEKISQGKIPTPTHNQYTFDDWYTSKDYTTVFNCDEVTIEKDMTLYAKWKIVVTVNGKAYSSSDITGGGIALSSLKEPNPKTEGMEGCDFKGWYTDKDLTEKAGDQITTSMTLYPAYECKITISDVAGETHSAGLNNLKVDYGKKITDDIAKGFFVEGKKGTKNEYISKDNRYFAGWYTKNADGTENKVTENTTITTGMTLYAKWNVSYVIDGEKNETLISEGSKVKIDDLTAKKRENRGWVKSVTWYSDDEHKTTALTGEVEIERTGQTLYPVEEYYLPKEIKNSTVGINLTTTKASVDPETGALTLPGYTVSDNYKFVGWYKEDGTEFSTKGYTVTSDTSNLSLIPVSSRTFKITYSLDKIGENIKTNWTNNTETDTYTRYYGLDSLNKDKELKTKTDLTCGTDYAYELEGWKYADSSDKTSVITKISAATKTDITLVSSWKVNPTKTGLMVLAGEYKKEPLEWYIIEIEDSRMLVLSRYALEAKALDTDTTRDYKWSTASLRSWFKSTGDSDFGKKYGFASGDFAFPPAAVINTTAVYPSSTSEAADTTYISDSNKSDQFFLLSYEEYCNYVKGKVYQNATWINATDADSEKTVSWWLRTPNRSYTQNNTTYTTTKSAMCVAGNYIYSNGNLSSDKLENKDSTETVNTGNLATYSADRFIRPAFWYKYE